MWLINIFTLELEEFLGDQTPQYAILSHTWGEGELTFDDWRQCDEAKWKILSKKKGYSKIINTCNFVRNTASYGLTYVWIDTVCIDKRSSAELSEAINSMFGWYASSKICLVYMEDVDGFMGQPPTLKDLAEGFITIPDDICKEFVESRWFTRGWTLQELLAPSSLLYISKHWTIIGDHSTLLPLISKASKISRRVLSGKEPLNEISVARRMFWASRRITTRTEDAAYCLMGIFSVHMPLLYGEGTRAFRRLQLEIIKESNDQTLFAWESEERTSVFAPSPKAFASCLSSLDMRQVDIHEPKPYYMTNLGLCITLPLLRTPDWGIYIAVLNFMAPAETVTQSSQFCLILEKTQRGKWHALGIVTLTLPRFLVSLFSLEEHEIYLQAVDKVFQQSPGVDIMDESTQGFRNSMGLLQLDGKAPLLHFRGRQFMFAYFWKSRSDTVAHVMTCIGGTWKPLRANSKLKGILALHETKSAQILVFRIFQDRVVNIDRILNAYRPVRKDQDTGMKEVWYAVVYHPRYDWFVYPLGCEAPRFDTYDDIAEHILKTIPPVDSNKLHQFSSVLAESMEKRHKYHFSIHRPSWPLMYKRYGADCPIICLEILKDKGCNNSCYA